MHTGTILSDNRLIEGIRNDEAGMFELLFDRYWEDLFTMAFRRLHDQEEAEDIVQDIFTSIWERRHTMEIKTSLSAYLRSALKYHLIRNAARADLRKEAMEFLLHRMELMEASVLDMIAAGEIRDTLDKAIQGFPLNMQKIFLLRAEAFTVEEIAKAMGLSEQTVKNNTSEALRRLRSVLTEKHPDIPPSFYMLLLLFIKI